MSEASDIRLKKYFREIESVLLCPEKKKSVFINQLKADIDDYLSNSPDADMGEIISVFGTPEEIAAGFSGELSGAELKKRLSVKKAVLFAVLAALIIWAVFAVVSYIDVHTEAHGYFSEGILFIMNNTGGKII